MLQSPVLTELRTEVIRYADEFCAISDLWNDLWARSNVPVPTARASFILQWHRHFADRQPLCVITIWKGSQLLAGLPLVGHNWKGVYPWGSLPSNHWAQHGTLLVDRHADRPRVIEHLVIALGELPWSLLVLPKINLDDPDWQALIAACTTRYPRVLVRQLYDGMRAHLNQSWAALQGSWSRNRRRHIRRVMQRAEIAGKLELEIIERPAAGDLEPLVREAFEIEHRCWKGAQGTSVMGARNIYPFFLEQARHMADIHSLRLAFLKLNQQRIAFEYSWQAGRHLFKPKIGYDETFAGLSPGIVLEYLHFKEIHQDHRFEYVDFMGPRSERAHHWTNDHYPLGSCLVATRGTAAKWLVSLYRQRQNWKSRHRVDEIESDQL